MKLQRREIYFGRQCYFKVLWYLKTVLLFIQYLSINTVNCQEFKKNNSKSGPQDHILIKQK
jgi:hypothetical protein